MKITNVSIESFEWPRSRPIRNGMFVYTTVRLDIVTIETDQGLKGVGLGGGGPAARPLIESMKAGIVGQDPMNVERIWHQIWVPKLTGRRGTETRVISGIDIALWDLVGKITEQPVYKLLGGFVERIDVYIAGGYYEEGKGLKELAEEMEGSLEMGARAVKMKIGGEPIAVDVERVRTVREAIGPDIKLMVDANNAYRHHEAIRIAKRIEEYDIYWFEEPCGSDDYEGHASVAAATSIPVATGENEYTRYGFRDLIRHRARCDLAARCKYPRRRDRVQKGRRSGGRPRSGRLAARQPGCAHPSGYGHPRGLDPGVLPGHRGPHVGQEIQGDAKAGFGWNAGPAAKARIWNRAQLRSVGALSRRLDGRR